FERLAPVRGSRCSACRGSGRRMFGRGRKSAAYVNDCPRPLRADRKGGAVLIPVILSGGSGTRLWPLSRELYPKQLLPLVADQTMLQDTLSRLDGVAGLAAPRS